MNAITYLSKQILSLSPFELTALACVLGFLFTDGLNSNENQSLGNFYELLGQTLLTYGAQQQNLDTRQSDYEDAIKILKKKFGNIDDIITELQSIKY